LSAANELRKQKEKRMSQVAVNGALVLWLGPTEKLARESGMGAGLARNTPGRLPLAAVVLTIAGLSAFAPAAHAVSGATPWAVLRCQLSDKPIPTPVAESFYTDFFTTSGAGKGGMADYWSQVSMGAISLQGSQVLPWVPVNVTSAQDAARGQQKQAQDCIDATEVYLKANHVPIDLTQFYGLFVLQNNLGGEVGYAPGNMPVTINNQPAKIAVVLFEFGALSVMNAGHEMGHGYGLQHAEDTGLKNCSNGPGAYCDFWDVMGAPFNGGIEFENTTFDHPPAWRDVPLTGGESGPGLNAQHLSYLGWIPSVPGIPRSLLFAANTQCLTLQLAALGHPEVPSSNNAPTYFQVGIPPSGAFKGYTVEFRRATAWDRGMKDAVIIHSGWSPGGFAETFVMDNNGGPLWYPGDTFSDTVNNVQIMVHSFDLAANTAHITICRPGVPPPPAQPPDCQITFSCPYHVYTPPNYTVQCPVKKDFYDQLPLGELIPLITGTSYAGISNDYDESIRACAPGTMLCSQYSVWKGVQNWCAPPDPPPPGGPPGGCGGQKGPCKPCPGGICQ